MSPKQFTQKIAKYPFTDGKICGIVCPVRGALAQLVARHNGIVEAKGSTPLCSTKVKATIQVAFFVSCSRGGILRVFQES